MVDTLRLDAAPGGLTTAGGMMKAASGALVVTALVVLAACSGTGNPRFGDVPDDTVWDEPQEIDGPDAPVEPAPVPELPSAWVCVYSPTYDEDWHNDVECSDGVNVDRPYLREWDDFVTEDELMQSAYEYQDALNAAVVTAP